MTPLGGVPQDHVVRRTVATTAGCGGVPYDASFAAGHRVGQTVPLLLVLLLLLVQLVPQLGLRRQGLGMFAQFYLWKMFFFCKCVHRSTSWFELTLGSVYDWNVGIGASRLVTTFSWIEFSVFENHGCQLLRLVCISVRVAFSWW